MDFPGFGLLGGSRNGTRALAGRRGKAASAARSLLLLNANRSPLRAPHHHLTTSAITPPACWGAPATYEAFRGMLDDELGIGAAAARGPERRMLQQDPSLDAARRPYARRVRRLWARQRRGFPPPSPRRRPAARASSLSSSGCSRRPARASGGWCSSRARQGSARPRSSSVSSPTRPLRARSWSRGVSASSIAALARRTYPCWKRSGGSPASPARRGSCACSPSRRRPGLRRCRG